MHIFAARVILNMPSHALTIHKCIVQIRSKTKSPLLKGLHHQVGDSIGPGYRLLHFDLQEKMKLAKTTQLSSVLKCAAIYNCVCV